MPWLSFFQCAVVELVLVAAGLSLWGWLTKLVSGWTVLLACTGWLFTIHGSHALLGSKMFFPFGAPFALWNVSYNRRLKAGKVATKPPKVRDHRWEKQLGRLLGGTERIPPPPDSVVVLTDVPYWMGQIRLDALRDAGIHVEGTDSGFGTKGPSDRMRIYVLAKDYAQAKAALKDAARAMTPTEASDTQSSADPHN